MIRTVVITNVPRLTVIYMSSLFLMACLGAPLKIGGARRDIGNPLSTESSSFLILNLTVNK